MGKIWVALQRVSDSSAGRDRLLVAITTIRLVTHSNLLSALRRFHSRTRCLSAQAVMRKLRWHDRTIPPLDM
ncbi:hypothetical protein BD310DRAFT_930523 [Dichomitus squalens]|uniref:Uncharacterized protein n=1 Tax=Dichomitus squalens TaxID=114155 RepID=A0A4Q9PRJ7_9APHY|nr:hypothetical protein BD310DRAFT_930523 [Dichomitus squalens]